MQQNKVTVSEILDLLKEIASKPIIKEESKTLDKIFAKINESVSKEEMQIVLEYLKDMA
jgi:hypothetical protein